MSTDSSGSSEAGRRGRRFLVLAARPPWPPITGDRLRTTVWAEALAPHGEVTLVAPGGAAPPEAPAHRRVVLRRARGRLPGAALRVLRGRLPLTTLLAAPFGWREALAEAGSGGAFTATIVMLARTHPWVWGTLGRGRSVLDAVDSLASNLRERAAAAKGPMREFWLREAQRQAALEATVAGAYSRVVVVAEEEAPHFSGAVAVISHGVRLGPAAGGPRPFDFGFWGRLAYFANRDAALWLLREIWPAIRRELPQATLLVAGADCPRTIKAFHGGDGVHVVSPMDDRPALLRQVKVALFPVRFGSGQPNKVLEAGEASCAVVATAAGVRGMGPLTGAAVIADTAPALAEAAVALAGDPGRVAALGAGARRLVAERFDRRDACRRLAELVLEGNCEA